ncbi:MAG TPA: DUF3365 domain-containing protein [Pirellulaceae bacterium]|jgi:hypothetical protein|nr:DUF3365 domain-containing protein [Pirellulaceae bacterium]
MRPLLRPFVGFALIGLSTLVVAASLSMVRSLAGEEPQRIAVSQPPTVEEAKVRAQLLHETVHGALLVMHRDLFREDEGLTLPARSLDDVFSEMKRAHGVEMAWLAVDAQAMDVGHKADDEFEKQAVEAIAGGAEDFGQVEGDRYRHAGRIRLASECLKCHLPQRTSTEDRSAAVTISMQIRKQ